MKPEAGEIFTAKIRILSGVYQNYSANQNGSGKIIGMDRRSKICRKDQNQTNGPRSSRWLVAWNQNVVSTVQQSECLQKLEVWPCMKQEHANWHVEHEVDRPSTRCLRACNWSMMIDMCVLVWRLPCTPGMHPEMWEEVCRPAWGWDMQPARWSTRCGRTSVRIHAERHTGCHQPKADWLLSSINTPRPQIISTHPELPKPS